MGGYKNGKVEIWYGDVPPSNPNILWQRRIIENGIESTVMYEYNNNLSTWQIHNKIELDKKLNVLDSYNSNYIDSNFKRIESISSKYKVLTLKKIPDQFMYSPGSTTNNIISFCNGGYDYMLVQNTWINEAEVGGRVWWMLDGRTVKSATLTILASQYKMSKVAWSNFTDAFLGGVIVAGQHMYDQTWKIAVLNGDNGELVTSYDPPSGTGVDNVITAMCTFEMREASHSRLFTSCDETGKIYSCKIVDGTDVRSYDYPSGISTIRGLAINDWGLMFIADGSNNIYITNCYDSVVLDSFTIPCQANCGISLRDNNLHVLSQATNAIYEISLGGLGTSYNGNILNKIPVDKLLNRKNNTVTGGEPNVIFEDGKFRMWFSNGNISYCESTDGINFTEPTVLIPYGGRSHVFKIGATYHIYYVDVQDGSYSEIKHATSVDGLSWNNITTVLTSGSFGANCPNWNDISQIGNIYVKYIDNTYIMLVEILANFTWSVGYCTSLDGLTWDIFTDNPTTVNHVDPLELAPFSTKSIGRPKLFYEADGIYWFTAHISQTQSLPTRIGIFWSTDLKYLHPILSNPFMDFVEVEEVDQLSDAWMIEKDGMIYIYYSCVNNFGVVDSKIKVATINMTFPQLINILSI